VVALLHGYGFTGFENPDSRCYKTEQKLMLKGANHESNPKRIEKQLTNG